MKQFPLTKAQLQIADLEKFVGAAAGNLCCAVFFSTEMTASALDAALNELVRLNDALRLVIVSPQEKTQAFKAFRFTETPRLSFASMEEFQTYAARYGTLPMNEAEALFEKTIVLLPQNRLALLLKVHHIISDAWAMGLLSAQLEQLLQGGEVCAPSYEDYIQKEQEYLASASYRKDKDFFIRQIQKNPNRALLRPLDNHDFHACRKTFRLSDALSRGARAYLQKKEVSPSVFYLTVIGTYLWRILRRPESFYIGTPVMNRVEAKELQTIGMYVNNVPVRIALDEQSDFYSNMTENVEDSTYSVFRHQKCNYSDILRTMGEEAQNLYDVLFSYHLEQFAGEQLASRQEYYCGLQPEALQIHLEDRQDGGAMAIRYEYRTSLLSEQDVSDFHEGLMLLLHAVIEDDSRALAELPITPKEKESRAFGACRPLTAPACIYPQIETNLRQKAGERCLLGHGWALSAERFLSCIWNADRSIRTFTGGENKTVAIFCDRGPELYVAVYAALRAGCAFVPISPSFPAERVSFLLRDSESVLILTQEQYKEKLPETLPALSLTGLLSDASPETLLPPVTDAERTAYILYTSGSTGKPKGVKISNRALYNRLNWMQEQYPLAAGDVILQKTEYTFDVSLWEIFWWGMFGAGMAASAPGEHFLPEKIVSDIAAFQVTHIHFVPSVFRLFVAYLEQNPDSLQKLNSLKRIFLSGEAACAAPINRFQTLISPHSVSIHNLYGPTECAIDVTFYDCAENEEDPIPIGVPIANTAVYIVDEALRCVPRGVVGELLIGGANVGSGYLGREELTRRSFIPNPFGEGMLYRTGDLACFREDGNILYCGRRDTQLKLNGQRIEAGEVESAVVSFPGIEACMVRIEPRQGRELLCAYFSGGRCSPEELQRHCLRILPRYMIPTVWYYVPHFPLTESGKTDRTALLNCEKEECAFQAAYLRPETPLQRMICAKFAEILHRDASEIGCDTNFLLRGGSSLDVVTLMSEPAFESVPVSAFMANPTPNGLAALLSAAEKNAASPWITQLYEAENTEKTLILFPFAGGSASAFSALYACVREKKLPLRLCCLRYPHSDGECSAIADELQNKYGTDRLVFYAHCIGAFPALKLISELEERGNRQVEKLVVGGMIPSRAIPRRNPWRSMPKAILKKVLKRAGAPEEFFRITDEAVFLERFLNDTDYYFACFPRGEIQKISCPTEVFLSEGDPFTKKLAGAEKEWANYCSASVRIHVLQANTHYFQSVCPERLLEAIE